jgi:hypothetical protein
MVKRLILIGILAAAGASSAAACNCPKEQLIKEHGTVGVFDGPKVRVGPVRPAALQASAPVKTLADLPLLMPVRPTPAGPTSLEWLLLDP